MTDDDDIEACVQAALTTNSCERQKHARITNYFEMVIPKYNLTDFFKLFHMTRTTVEKIVLRVGRFYSPKTTIPVEKKVLLAIWILTHQDTFLVAGDRFGVAHSTAHDVFKETISIFKNEMFKIVSFPSDSEKARIAQVFYEKSHIDGLIGAIDGCHIPIRAPPNNHHDFYNRKQHHSIVLQGMCNDKLQFIDTFIGAPGRMHDAKIFKSSPIFEKLHNHAFMPSNYYIMGDNAYPNSKFLMTPFRDNGHLSVAQSRFNTALSSVRQTIERAFGLLKSKFRRLKFLDVQDVSFGNEIIAACIFLHNFVIQNEDLDNETTEEIQNEADILETAEAGEELLGTDIRLQFLPYFE